MKIHTKWAALLAGLSISAASLAQPCAAMPPLPMREMPFHGHGVPLLPPMLQRLELNETQQDEAFKIFHAAAPAMRQQEKTLHQARERLRILAQTLSADEAAVKLAIDQLARATAEIELLRFRHDQKILALLSAEQLQKLKDLGGKERGDKARGRP